MKKWNKQTWAMILSAFFVAYIILNGDNFDTSKAQDYRIINQGSFGIDNRSYEANISAKIIDRKSSAHTVLKAAIDIKELNPQLDFIRVRLYRNFIDFKNQKAFVIWSRQDGWDLTTQDDCGRQIKYELINE